MWKLWFWLQLYFALRKNKNWGKETWAWAWSQFLAITTYHLWPLTNHRSWNLIHTHHQKLKGIAVCWGARGIWLVILWIEFSKFLIINWYLFSEVIKPQWENSNKRNISDTDLLTAYFELLSNEEIKKLYNIYKPDFEQFNYSFEFREITYNMPTTTENW